MTTLSEKSKRPIGIGVSILLFLGSSCTTKNALLQSATEHKKEEAPVPIDATNLGDESCFGPLSATIAITYLHGLEGSSPSREELAARKILRQIAEQSNVRIALPRSAATCFNSWRNRRESCWQANDPQQVDATLEKIADQTKACLGDRQKLLLIGFSNGGWFTNKALRWCRKTPYNHLAAIGAGGKLDAFSPQSLSHCGSMYEFIGERDTYNLQPAKGFHKAALARGAQIKLIPYDGAHEFPDFAVSQLVAKLTRELKR